MASGAAPGAKILIYGVTPSRSKTTLFQGVNEQTGPGGAPDAVQATTKANELPFLPVQNIELKGGDKLMIFTVLTVSDGLDLSDGVFNIPIIRNGNLEYLSSADFVISTATDYPASTPAGVELQLGTGYVVPEGDRIKLGGGNYFISVQNDTA